MPTMPTSIPGYHRASDACFHHTDGQASDVSLKQGTAGAILPWRRDVEQALRNGTPASPTSAPAGEQSESDHYLSHEAYETILMRLQAAEDQLTAIIHDTARTSLEAPTERQSAQVTRSKVATWLRGLREAELKEIDIEYHSLDDSLQGPWAKAKLEDMVQAKYKALEETILASGATESS